MHVFYSFDVFHNLKCFTKKNETQYKHDGHITYKPYIGII